MLSTVNLEGMDLVSYRDLGAGSCTITHRLKLLYIVGHEIQSGYLLPIQIEWGNRFDALAHGHKPCDSWLYVQAMRFSSKTSALYLLTRNKAFF